MYKNRATISGELQYDTQAELTTKIRELITAYENEYQDFALYQDDGTMTTHAILNSHPDNMTGTRIVSRSWPLGQPAEYATCRTFRIVIEADFASAVDQLLSFSETVQFSGNGGPRWRMAIPFRGLPVPRPVSQFSPQTIIQSGSCIGFQGYPVAAPPSLLPNWLDNDSTVDRLTGPTFQGQQYAYYGREWSYTHIAPTAQNVVPTVR